MAQYTAEDLRNVTKAELGELLKKEGVAFDPKMPLFAMKALLLNKNENEIENENENDETMGKKKAETVANNEETVEKIENEQVENPVETETEQTEPEAEPIEAVEPEQAEPKKPVNTTDALAALRNEVVKRRGGIGLGKSAFAAELAKRRGERVTGVTFAQELKSRQLKYGK